jgi:glycerol-3-phosphate dehydrogenase (NAD(P)+)
MRIALLGAGAWGSALAIALSRGHEVRLWARRAEQRHDLQRARRSAYLPEVALPAAVLIPDSLEQALDGAELVLVALPTAALREGLRALGQHAAQQPLLWACKGFEPGTIHLPHQVVAQELGEVCAGALSGPSFALEVARGLPTALALASVNRAFAHQTARALHQPLLRMYFTDDIVGVEIGGAVKNVMAIATGICDGLGLGNNARAALVTRGLAELTRLGAALGARPETAMGLTGAGDLFLTCTGDLSRNRRVGLALARGEPLDAILAGLGHVAEGVSSASGVARLARESGVDMPITAAVVSVLRGQLSAGDAVKALLARDPKAEA